VSLTPGVRLGAYEIVQLVGAGGMGEVYRALDIRLNRTVAIKVLRGHLAADSDRRERFEREASAVAALNHPHICSLHDVGEVAASGSATDSVRFLVMEYLEGQTIAERLLKGPLPLPDVLRYGVEVAEALDHAHRRALVHRDVKPGNIMLTETGAKLLDFGLSISRPIPSVPGLATVSLPDARLTADGAVLGTFPYMAPEQLAGREADVRTDIFGFGATVYEMATGQRAFQGETAATLIGAILHIDPLPVSALQPLAPTALDRVVSRCLAKDPNDRWQTARDLMLELRAMADDKAPLATHRPRARLGVAAAAVVAVAAIAIAVVLTSGYARFAASDESAVQLTFSPPEGLRLTDLVIGGPVTVSADGARLAFVATDRTGKQRIWVRALGSQAAQALGGSEGGAYPFWSPDGQSIGFFAQRKLKTVQLSGGPSHTLCDAVQPRGGTWSSHGVILFAAGAGRQLYRVPAAGGMAMPVEADASNYERHWPSFLPDGRHFVYYGRPQKQGIYVAALDVPEARLLLRDYVGVAYTPPGHLLVLRGPSRGAPAGALLAYPFDAARTQITGEPALVADRVRYESGLARGAFAVSATGTLAYGDIDRSPTHLTSFDRTGKELGHIGGSLAFGQPALSPDEKTVAVEHVDPVTQDQDLWLIDVARDLPSRFTSEGNNITFMPVWSPDGAQIVFSSARGTPPNLYQKASAGSSGDELLLESRSNHQPTDWTGEGPFIVYAGMDPWTQWDLWLMPASGTQRERKPIPLLRTDYNEHLGRVSPNGLWLAYASDESGSNEVYVRPFRRPGPTQRISADGGSEPKWRGDGRELFYLAADGSLMAAGVRAAPGFEIDVPVPLFKVRMGPTRNFGYDVNYSVTRDGQRFVVRALDEDAQSTPTTTVILNWRANLSRR